MTTTRGLLRLLHFIGLAMFLGSIFGHIVLGMLPGAETDRPTIVLVRAAIALLTQVLTVPGVVLLVVTGLWMVGAYYGSFFRLRWLTVHQVLGALILVNTVLILRPLGTQMLEVARSLHENNFDLGALHELEGREATFGPINLLLSLTTIIIAIFRPAFGQRGVKAGK